MSVLFDLIRNPKGCNLNTEDKVDLTPVGRPQGGVIKHLIEKGEEAEEYPNYGDKILFEYYAYNGTELLEEKLFDSSEKDGKPFEYECLKGSFLVQFSSTCRSKLLTVHL